MNTRQIDEYLKRLKRRERYLENLPEEKVTSFDRSELVALSWSIRYVEDTILEAAEHQYKWFNETEKI